MKKIFIIILILLSFQLLGSQWQKEAHYKDIANYSRTVNSTGIKEYMAVTTINAPIELVGVVLLDVPNHKNWIADCGESKIIKNLYGNFSDLKNIKAGGFMQYYIIKTPWPVMNRDVIIKTDFSINWNKGKLNVKCIGINKPHLEKNNDNFRMTGIKIYWSCKKISKNKTRVIYRLSSNPGGSIPISLANKSAANMAPNTVINLKNQCSLKKYKIQYNKIFQK